MSNLAAVIFLDGASNTDTSLEDRTRPKLTGRLPKTLAAPLPAVRAGAGAVLSGTAAGLRGADTGGVGSHSDLPQRRAGGISLAAGELPSRLCGALGRQRWLPFFSDRRDLRPLFSSPEESEQEA